MNRMELNPRCFQHSKDDPEAYGRRYKTLDPEEDFSLRPDFGGRGPFSRLAEPRDWPPTSLKRVRSNMPHPRSYKDVISKPSKKSFWPEELKRSLANAARKALQSDTDNLGSIPFATTILQFLDRTSSYEDLCELLESEGLKIERRSFAQQLLAAVPALQHTACPEDFPSDPYGLTDNSVDTYQLLENDIGVQNYAKENTISVDQGPAEEKYFRTPIAGEFRYESTPHLKAPIANMVIQPLPILAKPADQLEILPKPDKPHPLNREAESEALDTLVEHSKDANLEVIQSALDKMENIIRIQKENSKGADLEVLSVSHKLKNPKVENAEMSGNLSKTGMSPSYSESDLFFSEFDNTDTASHQQYAAPEIMRFDAWSNVRSGIKSIKPRLRDEPKIYDFFGPDKNPSITAKVHTKTTLGDGHFARHEKRKEALNEYAAECERSRHQDAFDGQVVDLNLAANQYDQATAGHPTTGGKGISDATIRHLESDRAAQAYATPTDSEIDRDELREPEPFYQYRVHIREWLADESEVEARLTELGPWHTKVEANAVAAERVQKPSEDNTTAIFQPGAWSYNFNRDQDGMETHIAGLGGGFVEASVSRNIAPANQYAKLQPDIFTIPRVVYLAMLQRTSVPVTVEDDLFEDSAIGTSTDPDLMQATALKACTTLDLANKAASRKWLDLETKDFAADSLDDHRRALLETSLRKELRQMNEDDQSFDRTISIGILGERFHVWVEKVVIDGPRN
ncbi:MAG: hypothetical protein Q9195_002178 [Heterodermia aff. obscurata]